MFQQQLQPLLNQLAAMQESLAATPRTIERIITVREVDTIPGPPPPPQIVEVPAPPAQVLPAEHIEVPGPKEILTIRIPTPVPAGVCVDPRSFTSSHTFRPGLGQFAYMGAGFLLGLIMTVEATAEAQVFVQ